MKKATTIMIITVLCAACLLSFCACGGNNEKEIKKILTEDGVAWVYSYAKDNNSAKIVLGFFDDGSVYMAHSVVLYGTDLGTTEKEGTFTIGESTIEITWNDGSTGRTLEYTYDSKSKSLTLTEFDGSNVYVKTRY